MSDDEAKYYRLDWMDDNQWNCALFWAQIMRGFHHVGGKFKQCGSGVSICEPHGSFATFDFNNLTRLVLLAHEKAIRVEIGPGGPRGVKFTLHQRHAREGRMNERHPTIEQAIADFKG